MSGKTISYYRAPHHRADEAKGRHHEQARGDILKLFGTKVHINRIAKAIGYADRPSNMTDMVWVGLFIVVFGLIDGAVVIEIAGRAEMRVTSPVM